MIGTHLFFWTLGKLSDQLRKVVVEKKRKKEKLLCHVMGSAGTYSGHKVTSVTVMLTGQGLPAWLSLLSL